MCYELAEDVGGQFQCYKLQASISGLANPFLCLTWLHLLPTCSPLIPEAVLSRFQAQNLFHAVLEPNSHSIFGRVLSSAQ